MNTNQSDPKPVTTKEGQTIDEEKDPSQIDLVEDEYWRELDGTKVPIKSLSDQDILKRMDIVNGKIAKHRRNIVSRQHTIIFLSKIHENLASELRNREGVPNLLLPNVQFVEKEE